MLNYGGYVVGRIKYLENSLSLVFAGIYFHKEKWLGLTLGLPPVDRCVPSYGTSYPTHSHDMLTPHSTLA